MALNFEVCGLTPSYDFSKVVNGLMSLLYYEVDLGMNLDLTFGIHVEAT